MGIRSCRANRQDCRASTRRRGLNLLFRMQFLIEDVGGCRRFCEFCESAFFECFLNCCCFELVIKTIVVVIKTVKFKRGKW